MSGNEADMTTNDKLWSVKSDGSIITSSYGSFIYVYVYVFIQIDHD